MAIVDSGTSGRCGPLSLDYKDKLLCNKNMHVSLRKNTIIFSTHTAYLNLPNFPNIPRAALNTCLFQDIHDKILLSVSKFCDHGYKVLFNIKHLFLHLIKIK